MGAKKIAYKILVGDHKEYLDVGGRIILKWILEI
jgi:hypothetical protein